MFLTLLAAATMQIPPETLRVGTYHYPRFDRTVALRPLADLVERQTGRPVQVVLLDTPSRLSKALCDGEIDVAMTNLGGFVQVRDCPNVRPIAVLDTPPAVLERYRGILLVRRDTRAASLAALKRRTHKLTYGEVLPGSTSGALVQAAALHMVGISPSDFKDVLQSGTHEGALKALLERRADVVAMAEEPWRKLQVDDPVRASSLHVLWRSQPLPVGPVICRDSPALRCDGLTAALLGPAGAEVATPLSSGWTETEGAIRFRSYNNAEYDPFRPQRSP